MTAAADPPEDTPPTVSDSAAVVRIDRAEAASIALKVSLNDREGKESPRWMREVAERMGVRSAET